MVKPFRELSEKVQQAILYGTGKEPVVMTYDDGLRRYQTTEPFEGRDPEHGPPLQGDRFRLGP